MENPLDKYKKVITESDSSENGNSNEKKEKSITRSSINEIDDCNTKFYSVLFLCEPEKELLSEILNNKDNKSELGIWYGLNFLSPLLIIFLSFLIAMIAAYYDSISVTFNSLFSIEGWSIFFDHLVSSKFIRIFTTVVFNGSISLIAINALLTSSSFIIAKGNCDENTQNAPIVDMLHRIRRKLNFQQILLLIISATVYIIQIVFTPTSYFGMLLISIIIFLSTNRALSIAKKIYIARETAYQRVSKVIDESTRNIILRIQEKLQ